MSHLAELPPWVALVAAFFVVFGATLALIGAFGVAVIRSFYDRIHAPTIGTSWGVGGIMVASILVFSFLEGRAVLHVLAVGIFIMLTTPVTLMILARAALQRDRAEGAAVPHSVTRPEEEEIKADPDQPAITGG